MKNLIYNEDDRCLDVSNVNLFFLNAKYNHNVAFIIVFRLNNDGGHHNNGFRNYIALGSCSCLAK